MDPAAWPSSRVEWNHGVLELGLPDRVLRSKPYMGLLQALQTVKGQANRAVLARQRENIGKTPAEAAAMLAVSDTKKAVWADIEEKCAAVLAFEPTPIPVDARLMSWKASSKYRAQLGSELVHRVARLVQACQDGREHLNDVFLEKKRLVAAKNNEAVTKVMKSVRQAVKDLSEYVAKHNLRGRGLGLSEGVQKALLKLAGVVDRHDAAVCSLTGAPIQTWRNGEGTLRYACPDGDGIYQTRDMYDRFRRVKDKIHSVAHYPGLVDACLDELRKLDPYVVDGHWVLESTIPARVRTVTAREASTPAVLLTEVATAFKQRLCLGLPSRLAHTFTLPQEFLHHHKGFAWLTYSALNDLSITLAHCMRSFLGRSSVVAIACVPGMNRMEWYLMDVAAAHAGYTVVPIHANMRRDAEWVTRVLNRWTVRAVVCHERDVDLYRDLKPDVPSLRHIVVVSHNTNTQLRAAHKRRRGHSLHSFRSLCGVDGYYVEPPAGDEESKAAAEVVPTLERVVRSEFEEPFDQPKGGPGAMFALQLTAGGMAAGRPRRRYPPKAVVVSAERVLRELPTYLPQPHVTLSADSWSLHWERFRLWDVMAHGGRLGLVKHLSDRRIRREDHMRRRAAGEKDVSDTDPESESEEEEEEETPRKDDMESLASSVGPGRRRASTPECEEEEEEEKEEDLPPPEPDEEDEDELAHTLPEFETWWQEFLLDYNTLGVTRLVAPGRVWAAFCAVYADRKAEIEAKIKAGYDALAKLAQLEVEKGWRGKEAIEREYMKLEDDASMELSKAIREEEKAAKAAAAAGAGAAPGVKRGNSSRLADMMASVEAMATKIGVTTERPPTPPPEAPRGKWTQEHVKPHHTAAALARQVVGDQVKSMVCAGPGLTTSQHVTLNKALWPRKVTMEVSAAETGVFLRNGTPTFGTTLEIRVPRRSDIPPTRQCFNPETVTYEVRQHGILFVKNALLKDLHTEYYRQPETTAALLPESGWFQTGDLATVYGDGAQYELHARQPIMEGDVEDMTDAVRAVASVDASSMYASSVDGSVALPGDEVLADAVPGGNV